MIIWSFSDILLGRVVSPSMVCLSSRQRSLETFATCAHLACGVALASSEERERYRMWKDSGSSLIPRSDESVDVLHYIRASLLAHW